MKFMVSITPRELSALESIRPTDVPLATWVRERLFSAVFKRCAACKKLMLPEGRHVYGPCKSGKK